MGRENIVGEKEMNMPRQDPAFECDMICIRDGCIENVMLEFEISW